jgi:hypothetical protein
LCHSDRAARQRRLGRADAVGGGQLLAARYAFDFSVTFYLVTLPLGSVTQGNGVAVDGDGHFVISSRRDNLTVGAIRNLPPTESRPMR